MFDRIFLRKPLNLYLLMKPQNHDQCRKDIDQLNSQLNSAREEIKIVSGDHQKLEQLYDQVSQELQNLKKTPSVRVIICLYDYFKI
jgi:hypothetical protein